MLEFLTKSHNGLRWVVLILMLTAIAKAFIGKSGNKIYASDRKWMMFAMISLHIQLVIGLALYFYSPTVEIALTDMAASMKSSALRFWAVEHILGMFIAIAIATFGYSKAKRLKNDARAYNLVFWSYLIALFIIIATIPWPFRAAGIARPWF